MRALISICLVVVLSFCAVASESNVLDKTAIQNIDLKLGEAKARPFEKIAYAIGRLEEVPSHRGILSSRIAGKIVELKVTVGDLVEKGQVLAVLESRQVGDPPPRVPLTSPISGMVVTSQVHLGEPVEPSDRLMTISDRRVLWARASIPEGEMEGIHPGTKARLIIPAIGRVPIEATLKRFGIQASSTTSSIDGIFEVPNPRRNLSPGMRVEFSIVQSSRPSVMSIPRTAVQGDPLQYHVYVQNFTLPNAFEKMPVVLGEENDLWVEVISGIFPGDQVVTQGSYALRFSGAGTGMSLKEALDAAHGHEHNEDGTEMTAEQKKEREQENEVVLGQGQGSSLPETWLLAYAGFTTILSLWLLQNILRNRRRD